MSDSHLNIDNEISYNVSHRLIKKAISDPKVAENGGVSCKCEYVEKKFYVLSAIFKNK